MLRRKTFKTRSVKARYFSIAGSNSKNVKKNLRAAVRKKKIFEKIFIFMPLKFSNIVKIVKRVRESYTLKLRKINLKKK